MTTASEDTLRKIRGLLAKAEHESTGKEEAETFMAHAMMLMAKYGVERTMLIASDPAANIAGDRIITVPGPYATARMLLLHSICDALGVRTIRRPQPSAATQEIHLFGLASDLERADMLYTSLLIQALRFLEEDKKAHYEYTRAPKKWTRDWLDGFRATIWRRLKDAERRARQEADKQATTAGGPSTDLVWVRKEDLIKQAVAKVYPTTRTSKSYRRVGAGYNTGKLSGHRADLGGTRISPNSGRSALAG